MSKKIVDLNNIARLASALDSRMKNKIAIEELRAKVEESNLSQGINEVRTMLGGKSLVYLTQAEYDDLSEGERNDEDIMYFITDAEDFSHVHDNLELLNSLDEEYFADLDSEINELTTNITNEIDRATEKENEIIAEVARVEGMLGGKSFVYLTQAEYDNLTEEGRNDESIIYCITDAGNTSHEHANQEFLDSLNQEVLDAKQDKEDQNLLTENKTIVGAINELQILSEELDTDIFNATAKTIELDIKKLDKEEFDSVLGNLNLEDMDKDIFDLQAKAIELETYKADKEYVDNKLSTMDAITLNGYSIWVGNAEELEQIVERDPNTLYFEINDEEEDSEEDSEEVVQVNPVNGVLTLTTNKYQKTTIADGTEILFPSVNKFTEIHLYFAAGSNMNISLPDNCKWRVEPNIEEGNYYEIVAVYNTMFWLVNVISYSDEYNDDTDSNKLI